MREASVLLRETSAKRAQRRSAEAISRVNKDVAVFAAGTIQKMMQRQETRRERIERDFAQGNKKSAADAVDRISACTAYPWPKTSSALISTQSCVARGKSRRRSLHDTRRSVRQNALQQRQEQRRAEALHERDRLPQATREVANQDRAGCER